MHVVKQGTGWCHCQTYPQLFLSTPDTHCSHWPCMNITLGVELSRNESHLFHFDWCPKSVETSKSPNASFKGRFDSPAAIQSFTYVGHDPQKHRNKERMWFRRPSCHRLSTSATPNGVEKQPSLYRVRRWNNCPNHLIRFCWLCSWNSQ